MPREVDIAIIGAGSAGLYALSEVRRTARSFVLINGGPHGTTCARVGCMPSKVLIQAAEDFHRRAYLATEGIGGAEHLRVDIPAVLRHVRKLRDGFTGRVIGNAIASLGERRIDGYAEFVEPHVLRVGEQLIRAGKIILATGSRPVIPAAWQSFQDRILTTDTLFEQEDLPPSLAVLGLGVIGLEMGQALSRLGVHVTGVDVLEHIGGLQDPAVNRVAVDLIGQEFPLWLGHAAEVEQQADGRLRVSAGGRSVVVDKLLASLGRAPNTAGLGLDKIGVKLDARGVPAFDPHTMQVGDLPIFIAGDADGERAVLHEAGDEGRIAGFNAARAEITAFARKPRLGITFCDPNLVGVGAGWRELAGRADVAVGEMNFAMQGRAVVMGRNRGLLRVYGEKPSGRLLGAEMAVPGGEHLGHVLALAVQQGMSVFDLLKMPFYHPVVEEGLQGALYSLCGQLGAPAPQGLLELEARAG